MIYLWGDWEGFLTRFLKLTAEDRGASYSELFQVETTMLFVETLGEQFVWGESNS